MPQMTFTLSISPEQLQRYYQGAVSAVVTRTDDGRTLRFPAEELRPFVGHNGVHGQFKIEFDSNNKLVSLTRLD